MALTASELQFIFSADTRQLDRALHGVESDVRGTANASSHSMTGFWRGQEGQASRFKQIAGRTFKAVAFGAAGVGFAAGKYALDSIKAASDLEESTNKLTQVFGDSSKQIEEFASGAATAMGQTNLEARNAAATFGIFGKAAKMTDRENVKFSKQMTKLASDLASFHNTKPEEAIEALSSALRGEAEPIRKYGILLDEATLKAEALAAGIIKPVVDHGKVKQLRVDMIKQQQEYNDAVAEFGPKSLEAREAQADLEYLHGRLEKASAGTIETLTQEQKILAARAGIMKQSSDAQGDFARTSDGLANQQRILKARWEDTKLALGEALLPAMTGAVSWLNKEGVPAFERFSDWFVTDGIPAIKDFGGFLRDDVVPPLETAAGFAKDLAKWLNDLPKEVKIGGLAALAALTVGAKLRGGDGALGTAGKVLGLTKPVPVIVMNPGFGAGGVGGKPGPGGKVPPVAVPGGTNAGRFLKFAPLLPALGALDNDQLPDLMTDKQAEDFRRKSANIQRATNFWLDYERAQRTRVIPTVDVTHEKFKDLFDVTKKVDDKDPRINLFIEGYSDTLDRLARLRSEVDYLARPRTVRITAALDFDTMDGRRVQPGLQERAAGGPTNAGQWYIVGEKGPELFQAGMPGRVYSNRDSQAMLDGGVTPGGSGSGYVRLDPADVQAITRALLQARPVHGDVHVSGDPTVFRREMDADAHAAAYSGMPPAYSGR